MSVTRWTLYLQIILPTIQTVQKMKYIQNVHYTEEEKNKKY